MGVWKDFCRTVESKAVRRHFGDFVPLIETCAIFEFTDEQIERASGYEPDSTEVQPFPFPRMCCVGPGGVLTFQSPEMDVESGVLTYEMFMANRDVFVTGRCTLAHGIMDAEVTGLRGLANGEYFDEKSTAPRVREPEIERALRAMRKVDPERADEMDRSLREREDECARLEQERMDVSLSVMRDQFNIGLREIRWINKPDHYTVEVGPSAPPRKGKRKTGRVTRLAERSRHIVLTKAEIAEAWHRVHRGGTHASPLPHLRRGHYRTLRADRFGESKGKRVWVRATHVNGQCVEWRDGDVRYRVV